MAIRQLLRPCLNHIYGFIKVFLNSGAAIGGTAANSECECVITNSSSERVADSLFAVEKYSSAALTALLSYSLIYKNTSEYYDVQFPSDRIF
jgi:hypothetical protein